MSLRRTYHGAAVLQLEAVELPVHELEDLLLSVDQRVDDGIRQVEAVVNRDDAIVTKVNLTTTTHWNIVYMHEQYSFTQPVISEEWRITSLYTVSTRAKHVSVAQYIYRNVDL